MVTFPTASFTNSIKKLNFTVFLQSIPHPPSPHLFHRCKIMLPSLFHTAFLKESNLWGVGEAKKKCQGLKLEISKVCWENKSVHWSFRSFFFISVFSVELCIFLDYYLSVLLDGVEAKSQRYILPKLFDIGLLLLILEVNCFLRHKSKKSSLSLFPATSQWAGIQPFCTGCMVLGFDFYF